MYLLKASVNNLGMNRAALQRSGEGSGGGEGAIPIDAAVCGGEETNEEAVDFADRQNVDGRPPRTAERSVERVGWSDHPKRDQGSSSSDAKNAAAAGRGMSAAAASATAGEAASRQDRLSENDLHDLFSARAEPTLLPLYPPGDPFLICNVSKVQLNRATPSSQADGSTAREAGTGEGARVVEVSTAQGGRVVRSNKGNSAAMGVEGVVSAADEPGVGVDNVGRTVNVDNSSTATADIEVEKMTQEGMGALEEMSYSGGSESVGIEDCSAGKRGGKGADGTAAGGAGGDGGGPVEVGADLRSEDREDRKEILMVRVPHQHFLRMPVSPSMIEDHFISSYRHGLAGVKRGGMAMMQQVPRLPTSVGGQ